MATSSTATNTIDRMADALGRGRVGRQFREFPPMARAAAYCAMVEELAPGTPLHERAKACLEIQQEFTTEELGRSRAIDQLILGWDWWRWYARFQIDVSDDQMAVAA